MLALRFRRPLEQQPQRAPEIDWGNPLTEGLIFCVPGIDGNYDDIAGGKKATVTGVKRYVTADGEFAYFDGAGRIDYPAFGAELPRLGKMTLAFIEQPVAPSGYGTIVDFLPGGGTSEFVIYRGASPYGFAVGMRGSGTSVLIPEFTDSMGAPEDGKLRRIIVRTNGDLDFTPTPPAAITLFVGQEKLTTAKSAFISGGTASVNRWGALSNATDYWDGVIGQKCIWNRELSDEEARLYNENPQRIFKTRRVILSLASAPAADTSLSGSASMAVSASGALSTSIRLSGSVALVGSASGVLAAAGALLTGAGALQVSASGTLFTAIPLSGAATVQAFAAGALTTQVRLSGAASLVSSASGVLAGGGALLVGDASLRATGSGVLSTSIRLSGAASIRMSAGGTLSASAKIDLSKISPARIVVFEGSGSRVTPFDSSGSRVTPFEGSGSKTVRFE